MQYLITAISGFFMIIFIQAAYGDSVPYSGKLHLEVHNQSFSISHDHDWASRYSVIMINDVNDKNKILVKSPPLRYIGIIDGEYILGLSDIKFENNIQIILLNMKGERIFERGVDCSNPELAGSFCGGSVTNYISWFNAEDPDPALIRLKNGELSLSIRSPHSEWCSQIDKNEKLRNALSDHYGKYFISDLKCNEPTKIINFILPISK